MSDAEGGQTPADAGSELADPDTMSTNEQQQDGHRKVAQAINGFGQMSMERTGGCNYSVFSWRNGENTVHRVNTARLTCTCQDAAYNKDGQEVCDHVAYAVYNAPRDRDIGEEAFGNIVGILSEMNDYKNALEQRRNHLDHVEGMEPDTDTSAVTETAQKDADEDETSTAGIDSEAAADRLQEAYDDVVDDMQVQVGPTGALWVQTGMDTPDTLPGPGNVSPFDALLKDPEQVEYIHDDHAAVNDKPGEWWKNRIEPSDVDAYIEEVLE